MKKFLFFSLLISGLIFFLKPSNKPEEIQAVIPRKKRTNSPKINTQNLSREELIIQNLKDKKSIIMRDLEILFPDVTVRTLRRDMEKLQKRGIVKKTGSTKSSEYKLIA